MTDTPANPKNVMKGQIVEIVCSDVRKSFAIMKQHASVHEVQAFGDRLNIVINSSETEMPLILSHLQERSVTVTDWRVIKPSLENVFISLLSETGKQ